MDKPNVTIIFREDGKEDKVVDFDYIFMSGIKKEDKDDSDKTSMLHIEFGSATRVERAMCMKRSLDSIDPASLLIARMLEPDKKDSEES